MTNARIIKGQDGDFSAYVAVPNIPNGAALIVIQEIFGINKVMRDLCDGFAEQGYLAVAPDLFWRLAPGIDITDQTPEEWQQAFDLFSRFNVSSGVQDIQSTIDDIRHTHPKIGAVGYCLGGLLAYLTACETDCDAAVSYYGVSINEKLDKASTIKKPLLMHIAEKDSFVPPEAQATIRDALSLNTHVTLYTYTGLDHAFARKGGEHYDTKGADTANARTADFLRNSLT